MRYLIVALLVAVTPLSSPAAASSSAHPVAAAVAVPGLHDFDFLIGRWHAHHRKLKQRLANSHAWIEFEGTLVNQPLMDGYGNVDDTMLDVPGAPYRGVALRSFDPKTRKWSIWWLDGRAPSDPLDPPMIGGFRNGVGTFYGDDVVRGKRVRARFIWSNITPASGRWEQADSPDDGKTWETNWVQDITRVGAPIVAAVPLASAAAAPSAYPVAATARDGRNDFNFEYGTWRTHYRLLAKRLAGSHDWDDCYGTSVIEPFWGGSGNLEDGDLKCPKRYIGGMTLRLYNAKTHQWTLWWGTKKLGVAPPAQVGHFAGNGVGDFYAYDTWEGKPVICRFQWTVVNGNPRFEQAYSVDHGKTWETNWTTDYERVASSTKGVWNATSPAGDGHDGFDFLLGTWHTKYMRLRHPFVGSHDWYECDGTSTVRAFWGGAGNIEDGDLKCPAQYVAGMTLRLYDPATRQWSLYWATQKNGLAFPPQVGRFDANGVGDFLAPDTYDGKAILVKYHWAKANGNPRFEESFSTDNGKTWEVVWTTDYTPV